MKLIKFFIVLLCLQGISLLGSEMIKVNKKIILSKDYHPWVLVGIVEDLRSNGYKIPNKVDNLVDKICEKINFEFYHRNGESKLWRKDVIASLKNLNWIPRTEQDYQMTKSKEAFSKFKTQTQKLPVWETKGYLKGRVLTVGLKSYPFLKDMNNDGVVDLVLGDHDGFIYVYPNVNTNKKPVYKSHYRLKSNSTRQPIAVEFNPKLNFADMNGDGFEDLVLGAYNGRPYMLENLARKKGEFKFDDHQFKEFKMQDNTVLDAGNYVYPFVTDWNKDGKLDLLVGEISGNIQIYLNVGTIKSPVFASPKKIATLKDDMYPDPAFIDLDLDGKRDLIVGSRSGKTYYFKNIGTDSKPKFKSSTFLMSGNKVIDIGRLSHILLNDWNDDSVLDFIIGNDDGEVQVFLGDKKLKPSTFKPGFTLKTTADAELVTKVHPVISIADWNGDGLKDIIAGGENPDVRVFLNTGTKSQPRFTDHFSIPEITMTAEGVSASTKIEKKIWALKGIEFDTEYLGDVSPEAVDWNNDGLLDLLVGSYTGFIYYFENKGTKKNPKLKKPVPLKAGGKLLRVASYSTPRAVDWNNDGKIDLISGDLLGRIHIFINNSNSKSPKLLKGVKLSLEKTVLSMGVRSIPEFADINQDGKKDIIVGNRYGLLYALINKGTESNPKFNDYEILRDKSDVWKELYGGGWIGPRKHFPLRWKMGKTISNFGVEATSCPRFVDFDSDGTKEMLISHRFGRVFIYPIPIEK